MERLTEKHYLGTDHYMKCSENCDVDMGCIDCPSFDRLVERLAAYEDTGMTPEQCENAKVIIESAFSDDTSKAERIRELLKADRDGRLVVLPRKVGDTTSCETCKYRKDVFVPCDWLMQQEFVVIPPCPRYEKDE